MTKQVTFEAPEGFNDMAPKVQVNAVAAWVAACLLYTSDAADE